MVLFEFVVVTNEYVGDVTIPTQVIKYNQNFLQAVQPIRLQYSNKIKLYANNIRTSLAAANRVHPFCNNLQSWERTHAVLVISLYELLDPTT
jgi:hypothetical protein